MSTPAPARLLLFAAALGAHLALTAPALASWYTCSTSASLHAIDESTSSCPALATSGGELHWPVGSTLVFSGGECEECPTVGPCPDDDPDCNADACYEYLPTVHIRQGETEVEATWVEATGAPCGWSRHLTTDLEPGRYQVSADNGDASWTWDVLHGDASEDSVGCASTGGPNSGDTSLIAALLILAAVAARRLAHR